MPMEYRYKETTKRLTVYGSDGPKDIQEIKKLIKTGEIPSEITTLFYQLTQHSNVGMIFRGKYLTNLLKSNQVEGEVKPKQSSIRQILKQINEANVRQSTHAGILVYSTNAKRFLFFLPRARGNQYGLLGGNPRESETPAEAVCRIAAECHIELIPECLITLMPVELDGTTYYNFLVLSEREFKVSLSEGFTNSTWRSYEAFEELSLHPQVAQLIEKDEKLQKLIAPIQVDFTKLIDEILHSS